jgi:hypothetical protein
VTAEDLIVRALRHEATPWPERAPDGLDVALVTAADNHGVTELLATMPAIGGWPDGVRAALNRTRRGEAAAEAIRRQHLIDLLAALHRGGIDALLMKGALMAYTLYPSPWLRPRLDTDLLVSPANRARADRVLRDLGYQPGTHFSGDFVTHQFGYERPSQFEFIDVVDLHWKIANPHVFADAFGFEELAADAVPVPALSAEARGLSAPHAFVLACVHRVAHHDSSERLIWLYDIHLLASAMDQAAGEKVVRLAESKQLRSVCAHGLSEARARFGPGGRGGWIDKLLRAGEATEPTAAFLRTDLKKIDVLVSDLRTLGSWRERLALVREHLFPPAAYMRKAYATTATASLLFAYVIRVVRGARKWFRAKRPIR